MALSLVPDAVPEPFNIEMLIAAADGGEQGSVSRMCQRGDIVPYLRWYSGTTQIWDVGESMERVLGVPREEFLNAATAAQSTEDDVWLSIMHREDRSLARKVVNETNGNEQHVIQYRLLDANGRYRWIRDEMRVIHDRDNRIAAIVGCWFHLDGKSIVSNDALTGELRELELLADVLCARARVRLLERDAGDLRQHLHWARQRATRRNKVASPSHTGSLMPRLEGHGGAPQASLGSTQGHQDPAVIGAAPWQLSTDGDQSGLVLFGQPTVGLDPLGRAPLDVEVLLRVQPVPNAEMAALEGPAKVLQAATARGMMGTLDQWVLEQALDTLVESGGSNKIGIAINISPQSVAEDKLVDWLRENVHRYGVSARSLSFEINERCVVEDIEAAKRLMLKLRHMGFRVTIDDFGIGGLGLYSLRDLPLDSVKLAGVMVEDLTESKLNRTFINALAGFASALGISTIAKHAQDAPTLKLLSELGIDAAQGKFVQVPRPLTELLSD